MAGQKETCLFSGLCTLYKLVSFVRPKTFVREEAPLCIITVQSDGLSVSVVAFSQLIFHSYHTSNYKLYIFQTEPSVFGSSTA